MWTANDVERIIHDLILLTGAVSALIAAWQGYRAKGHAVEAKAAADSAKVTADQTHDKVVQLESNTNNKMDQLLAATNAASFKAGQDGASAPPVQSLSKEI